jgi:glycosyltransferase involved in cell wall biosynthesis
MAHTIIGIITTKNRYKLLSRAVSSAISQTKKLDKIIICSDSNESECIAKEKSLAVKHRIFYISNNHTRNCPGVKNCAVLSYIRNNLVDIHKFDSHYIAFLDDDDLWHETYIEKCFNNIIDEPDFIVSGLIFQDGDSEKKLSIPQNLDVASFLRSNQHIQGSNIFIKLTSLLKCGLFDENMSSTVDRDLFVRLMFLTPNYVIINEHLVYADVDNSRWRVTNSIELKKEGLKKFFLKYSGIMSADTKSAFFGRVKRLFNIDIHDIRNSFSRFKS